MLDARGRSFQLDGTYIVVGSTIPSLRQGSSGGEERKGESGEGCRGEHLAGRVGVGK